MDRIALSLASSVLALIVNRLADRLSARLRPIFMIRNQIITANSASQFIVQGHTLAPGGPSLAVVGATFFLASSGTALVINGVTSALLGSLGTLSTAAPSVTIGNNQIITANSQSEFTIGGQILNLNGSLITISSTTFSLAPHASAIIVNGETKTLPQAAVNGSEPVTVTMTTSPVIAKAEFISDSQTAIAGGAAVTGSGVRVSLLPSENELMIGLSIESLSSGSTPILTVGSQIVTASKLSGTSLATRR